MDSAFPRTQKLAQGRQDADCAVDNFSLSTSVGDRYVALGGRATIIDDIAEMRTTWSTDLDAHFPPCFADANMIVIQVDVDRVEVHVRPIRRLHRMVVWRHQSLASIDRGGEELVRDAMRSVVTVVKDRE